MKRVIKKSGKIIQAYRLGEDSEVLQGLMEKGWIKRTGADTWEVSSREHLLGKKGVYGTAQVQGEGAKTGDYIKVDSSGTPYPIRVADFLKNHRHVSGDDYVQLTKPLSAWMYGDAQGEELQYLKKERGLILDESHPDTYFNAVLFGSSHAAGKDAVLVFYRVDRDEKGSITGVDFNFVERGEFEETYEVIEG